MTYPLTPEVSKQDHNKNPIPAIRHNRPQPTMYSLVQTAPLQHNIFQPLPLFPPSVISFKTNFHGEHYWLRATWCVHIERIDGNLAYIAFKELYKYWWFDSTTISTTWSISKILLHNRLQDLPRIQSLRHPSSYTPWQAILDPKQ